MLCAGARPQVVHCNLREKPAPNAALVIELVHGSYVCYVIKFLPILLNVCERPDCLSALTH